MNARAVAGDLASLYLESADPLRPHPENVERCLRGPVTEITTRILRGEEPESAEDGRRSAAAGGGGRSGEGGGGGWRDYLDLAAAVPSRSVDTDGPRAAAAAPAPAAAAAAAAAAPAPAAAAGSAASDPAPSAAGGGGFRLSRRSRARLDAFLSSCALSVPDDPLPSPVAVAREGQRHTHHAATGGATSPIGMPPTLQMKAPPMLELSPAAERKKVKGAEKALSLSVALSGYAGQTDPGGAGSRPEERESALLDAAKKVRPPRKDSVLRRISSGARKHRFPQFERDDLSVRLELYLRSLRRARECVERGEDECVVALEPARAMRARVDCAVRAFVATVGCVRSVSPVLTGLVGALTRELLAVEVLSEEVMGRIAALASEYEHQTSFASLAFLSTPEESGRAHLTPLLRTYAGYLQSEWRDLVAACELESMLSRAVDPAVRSTFKTIEFQSIGHLLDVCHSHRDHLERIRLPRTEEEDIQSQCTDPKVVRQALRDLRREIITVNGHVLPPAHSLKELVDLLAETLNSRTLSLHGAGAGAEGGRRRAKRSHRKQQPSSSMRRSHSSPADLTSGSEEEVPNSDLLHTDTTSESELSSGNEGDLDSPKAVATEAVGSGEGIPPPPFGGRTRSRSLDLETIDRMTRRLLVAASRTGTGGDAYFVVRDLFGDDEVEVLPARQPPHHPHRHLSHPSVLRGVPTIELIVRLASITIKCHGVYDVYAKPLARESEPLIRLHTTATETVALHEVRAGDRGGGEGGDGGDADSASGPGGGPPSSPRAAPPTVLILRERRAEFTGERSLSIRPASYERVQVWNTPS